MIPQIPEPESSKFTASSYPWIRRLVKVINSLLTQHNNLIEESGTGQTQIVLVSPNGTRYKVDVDNSGVLGTTPL